MRRWVTAVALASLVGCTPRGSRSPEAARDAYLEALRKDDPEAAYALLAPDVRARVDYSSFLARWKADVAERKATLEAAKAIDHGRIVAGHTATTVHADGVVLQWAKLDDRWYVTGGLPPASRASTPAEAIRSFLAALGGGPLGKAQSFLSPELADALREDWAARTEAIEAALTRPGAIELSEDLLRAQLRYEPQRVIVLEQTPRGWAITSLE
jgi:hypothetical protein